MLRIENTFFGDFVKLYVVSIGCLGEYDQIATIFGVGKITVPSVDSMEGLELSARGRDSDS